MVTKVTATNNDIFCFQQTIVPKYISENQYIMNTINKNFIVLPTKGIGSGKTKTPMPVLNPDFCKATLL